MAGEQTTKQVELFFGPQHPGVPGNVGFKLWLEGERIVDVELIPGFLFRGFEKMMENRTWEMNIVMCYRFCVEDPDNLEVAYAEAVDRIFKVEVPEKAKYVRMIMAEFSRIASHLFWANFMSGGVGLRTTGYWAIAAREEILKWFAGVTGHRIYHSFSVPGGIRWDVPRDFRDKTLDLANKVEDIVKDIEEALLRNPVFKARTKNVGVLKAEDAIRLGVTGPSLRAGGMPYDIRKAVPYENYDKVKFNVPVGENGDSYERSVIRFKEIHESLNIIRQSVEEVKPGAPFRVKLPLTAPAGVGISRVESARGEYMIHVISMGVMKAEQVGDKYVVHFTGQGGRKPYRVRLRSVSLPLLTTVLKHIVRNEEVTIADFPVIVKSLDPCPPDIDR